LPLQRYNQAMTGEIMTEKKIRVLIAKPGLDGHDRGAKVIARALRDDGMEVIYTGLRQTPEMISEAALQEDVDVIGLSILSGAHNALIPEVLKKLEENGQTDVLVFLGGIIPEDDIRGMLDAGIYKVYGPGTDTRVVCQDIREAIKARATAD
jgi:methylmalonyl-CoA mutase C-terminal domain/subunit